MSTEEEEHKRISRRSFIKGAAAGAAGVATTGMLAGCGTREAVAPIATNPPAANVSNPSAVASACEEPEDVKPIPPVDPPAKWDKEADVVVVGTGGGGVTAAAYAAKNGNKVVFLEKDAVSGGMSKYSCYIIAGGSKMQEAAGAKFDPEAEFNTWYKDSDYTIDPHLLKAMIAKSGPAIDWMADVGTPLAPTMGGRAVAAKRFVDGKIWFNLSARDLTDHLVSVAEENGAEGLYNTKVTALVRENGRIVGVQAEDAKGKQLYVKANKAVILAAGGFTHNKEMLKKYVPFAYYGTGCCYSHPSDTGECVRMGLGAGADVSGRDSFRTFDGGIDYTEVGGPWWRFLYQGDLIVVRQPWLKVDRQCQRFMGEFEGLESYRQAAHAAASLPGHRDYVIWDSHFEEYIPQFKPGF